MSAITDEMFLEFVRTNRALHEVLSQRIDILSNTVKDLEFRLAFLEKETANMEVRSNG